MDIDLNLLGPYAKLYLAGIFKSESKITKPNPPPKRTNFVELYKCQSKKFLQGAERKRRKQSLEVKALQTTNRFVRVMATRGPECSKTMNKPVSLTENITPNIKPISKAGVNSDRKQHEEGKAGTITKELNLPKSNLLGKEKANPQQKQLTKTKTAAVKWDQPPKSVSKGANVLTTKNVFKPVASDASEKRPNTSKKAIELKDGGTENPTTGASKKGGIGLRLAESTSGKIVTRSMAKAINEKVVNTKKVTFSGKEGEQTLSSKRQERVRGAQPQPSSSKLIKHSAGPKKEIVKRQGNTAKEVKAFTKVADKESNGTEQPTNISKDQDARVSSNNEPELINNFLKPNPIDDIYITYNGKFATACELLNSYLLKWTTIVELDKSLPEDVQGDIRSALGKVNLLLRSKLPQFGSLLYTYLCQNENDTEKIFPCDLDGWWEVASIQLKAMTDEFVDLDTRKKQRWPRAHPRSLSSSKISPSNRRFSTSPTKPRRVSRNSSITSESSKRTSFCILGVRESMGSINKIGAVPLSAEDVQNERE